RSGAATPVNSNKPSPSTFAPTACATSFAVLFISRFSSAFVLPWRLFCSSTKIHPGPLTPRPVFPSRVHPHPLLRMLPYDLLDHFGKTPGVFQDVGLGISRAHQFHRRLEAQAVLPEIFIPIGVAGYYCGTRMQGHARDPGRRACRRAKKVHEGPFLRQGVLVRKDSDCSRLLQHP